MRARVPGWMSTEFSVVRSGRSVAIVRNDFRAPFLRHRLLDCPVTRLRAVPSEDRDEADGPGVRGGRGRVRIVDAGSLGEAVVRPYRRGGVVERFNERHYFLGERAFAELVTTHRLWRRGAPVPEALAAVQRKRGIAYTACLVTRRVPRCIPASHALRGRSAAEVDGILEAMGRAVRALHQAGGRHADLNAHNLLVPEERDGAVKVIDLDRARVSPGPVVGAAAAANLRRLLRSLRKLGLDDALDRWDAFERAYAEPPDPLPAA